MCPRVFASSRAMGTSDFELDREFVARYSKRQPPFGFNGLGELVYIRSYSRKKDDGQKERWDETIERVVNGASCASRDQLVILLHTCCRYVSNAAEVVCSRRDTMERRVVANACAGHVRSNI